MELQQNKFLPWKVTHSKAALRDAIDIRLSKRSVNSDNGFELATTYMFDSTLAPLGPLCNPSSLSNLNLWLTKFGGSKQNIPLLSLLIVL